MLRRTGAFALVTFLGFAGGATAQPPSPPPRPAASAVKPNSDLRCMLVASSLARNKDERARAMAGPMMVYYYGRADARTPHLALGAALQAEANLLQTTPGGPAQMQAQAQTCVSTFETRIQVLNQLVGPRPAAPAGTSPPVAPAAPATKAPTP